jgi:hypothetical protein
VENNENVSNHEEKGQNERKMKKIIKFLVLFQQNMENVKKVESDEKRSNNQEKGQDVCKIRK